jgi:hypothetical protein
MRRRPIVLVELGLVELRYQAVREVLNDGASVTDVARRNKVSRQTVHEWLVKYANRGLPGLMDRSTKPMSCPYQMSPVVESRIVELRRKQPGWGPRTLVHLLGVEGFDPVPGGTSVIAVSSATVSSRQMPGAAKDPTTSVGSGPGRWSCGKWMPSAVYNSTTAPRPRSPPVSTITALLRVRVRGGACYGAPDL